MEVGEEASKLAVHLEQNGGVDANAHGSELSEKRSPVDSSWTGGLTIDGYVSPVFLGLLPGLGADR